MELREQSKFTGGGWLAQLGVGGKDLSAQDFEKRANLPPTINFDRSLMEINWD